MSGHGYCYDAHSHIRLRFNEQLEAAVQRRRSTYVTGTYCSLQPWSNQSRHHQHSLFRICLLKKWMTTTRWQNSQPSTRKLKRSKWWKTFPSRLTFCAVIIYYLCDKVSPLSHYFLTLAHSFLRMPGICVTSHKSTLSRRCCAAERTIENNFSRGLEPELSS